MRKSVLAVTLAAAFAVVPALSIPVAAATVDQVVKACDNMNAAKDGSCKMTSNKEGDITVCTSAARCTTCPVGGGRQCYRQVGNQPIKGTAGGLKNAEKSKAKGGEPARHRGGGVGQR